MRVYVMPDGKIYTLDRARLASVVGTASDAARWLGISRAAIYHYTHGLAWPRQERAEAIFAAHPEIFKRVRV
jgi:hypothetical protein